MMLSMLLAGLAVADNVTEGWQDDPAAAFAEAKSQSKPLLLLLRAPHDPEAFTWDETYGIGVCLTWPKASWEQPTEASRFSAWANRYQVTELPAAILFDPDGRAYALINAAQLSDAETTPDQLIEAAAKKLRHRNEAFTRADQLEGLDRARALHEGLASLSAFVATDYPDLAQAIVKLDADNTAGLREKYEPILLEEQLDNLIQEAVYPLVDGGHYAQARKLLDVPLTEWRLSDQQRQLVLGFQAQLYHTEGMSEPALALLTEAIDLSPESEAAEQLRSARQQIRDQAAALERDAQPNKS